jgi:4-amino-4-deoxy-L-arabinose transferase-like glycosyltransferase
MAMIAASTASAWAGWNWLTAEGGSRQRWWAAFWALLAIGFLAKGPIAWIPIGMAGWGAGKLERARRPGVVAWVLGVLLMLGLLGLWGIPALVMTHGEYAAVGLGKHVVMRSVAPLEGHGSKTWWSYAATFPFYFLTIWPSFFPWSIWLPPAFVAIWRRRKSWSLAESYLVTGIVLIFGIFTLSRTKLPHYTLPAFPFMALLMAAWWGAEREKLFNRTGIAMASGALALTLIAFPLARPLFVSQQLFNAAASSLTPGMDLATIEYHEPSLVWLFRSRIRGFDTSMNWKDVDDWMRKPGPRVCVIPSDEVQTTFRKLDPAWRIVAASGYDVANAHRLELSAIIKM